MTGMLRLIAGWDREIFAQLPEWNRLYLQAEFLLLVIVALISGTVWTLLFLQLMPWYKAFPAGIVMGLFIFLLDRIVGGSDWRLAGPLRHPGKVGSGFWARLGVRINLSIIFSLATSIAAQHSMFHDAIDQKLSALRLEQNLEVRGTYETRKHDVQVQRLGPLQTERDRLEKIVSETTAPLDKAMTDQAKAAEDLRTAQLNMAREHVGAGGRPAGDGKNYRAAETAADAERGKLAEANRLISIYQPRLAEAQRKLADSTPAYTEARKAIQGQLDALDAEMKSYLDPVRFDLLLSYRALKALYKDPKSGEDAKEIGNLVMIVLMTIELSYIAVRILFPQANLYTVHLIRSAVVEASKINRAGHDEMQYPNPPPGKRPEIRIVSSRGPAANDG